MVRAFEVNRIELFVTGTDGVTKPVWGGLFDPRFQKEREGHIVFALPLYNIKHIRVPPPSQRPTGPSGKLTHLLFSVR